MRLILTVALLALIMAAPTDAYASWLFFPVDYTGDTTEDEAAAFKTVISEAAQQARQDAPLFFLESEELWADAPECAEPECVPDVASEAWFGHGVIISIIADAAIYEMLISVVDSETGFVVAEDEDICIICETDEAAEVLSALIERAMLEAGPPREDQPVEVVVDLPEEEVAEDAEEEEIEDDGSLPWTQGPYRLRFVFQPSGAEITVNGEPAGTGSLDMRAAEQVVEVRAEAEGHRTFQRRIRIDDQLGRSASYFIQLQPLPQEPEVEERVVVQRLASDGPLFAAAPAFLGGGIALVATGGVLLAYDGKSACGNGIPRSQCAELVSSKIAGGIVTGVGAAAIGAGVTLFLLRRRANEDGSDAEASTNGIPLLGFGDRSVNVGWQQSFR